MRKSLSIYAAGFTAAALLALLATIGLAQTNGQAEGNYLTRETLAVRYVTSKNTKVNLTGTALSPRVTGRAAVEYKKNLANVKIKVENLDNPQSYGPFYTTFIVWAVTAEGGTENLREMPSSYSAEFETETAAQTFGIIITAEPHSAVKVPSQKIVAETTLPKNVTSGVQTLQANFRVDRGRLYETAEDSALKADYSTPRLVLGARRSLDIARRAGAKEFSAAEFNDAQSKLQTLEQLWPRNLKDENKFSGLARDVARLAQVARDQAIEREELARIENQRQANIRNLDEARAAADRAKADAERTKREADQARADAERARAQADAARLEADKSLRAAEDERVRRERSTREAEEARQREAASRAETERARADADRAIKQADDAKRERDAALQRLYVSLSGILDTKRETRGFIVNIGDVLFDTGRATLKPTAREKLSRLAGILLAYPGTLMLEVEGHTDSVGSDELNNRLSQARAESVSTYLTSAGVKPDRIRAVRGLGKTKPIAPNETAAGRQANRRVEVVIDDAEQNKVQ